MLRSYLLIAWRNLGRHKGFSFLNITGLAIGMAAAILILLWIQSELRYSRNYANSDRIYEVWNRYKHEGSINCWATTPKVMGAAIQADYPEVEHVARVNYSYPLLFVYKEQRITGRGHAVDSVFFQLFDHEFVRGNPEQALMKPESLVITEDFATSLFGNDDPIGKIVKVDNADNFEITAVVKNPSPDSRFQFKYLIPWSYLRLKGGDDSYWSNNSTSTFVLLKENALLSSIQPKIKTIRKKYDDVDPDMETFLYPFGESYLYGRFENGVVAGGRIEIVRLFGWIAGFIILVACINFMNLSTARSERRAREVGIRKVAGARKYALVLQFLGESLFITLLAAVIAMVLVQLSLPAFNELVQKKLRVEWESLTFWKSAFLFILVTGLLAGSYPALFLASFKPATVIKGTFKKAHALVTPRKILVVSQFTFAIVLIIATIVVRKQMQNAQQRQTGYERNNLVYHFMEGNVSDKYPLIKNELLASGFITSVTKTNSPLTETWSNTWGVEWKGKEPNDKRILDRLCVDDAIVKTGGFTLVAGRDFDLTTFPTDSNSIILNEAAVKLMGFTNPIGEVIRDLGEEFTVIGVVKDFIIGSPYRPIGPLVMVGAKGFFSVTFSPE